jgi:hypothetical protein
MTSPNVRRPASRNLELETLEPRHAMAASIIASLNSAGALLIEGTAGADQITVKQASNKINVTGVATTFDATKVKTITINTLAGDDKVTLTGFQSWTKPLTVNNSAGNDQLTNVDGAILYFAGTFSRTATGATTINTRALDWFDTNIRDAALRSLLKTDFADKVINRKEMLDVFTLVAKDRVVSADEFGDLTKVANNTSLFATVEYVGVLTRDVVIGNVANATYQGTTLGNLKANANAAQLEKLVGKWFLGADHPKANYGSTTYAYANASGTLFGSGGPKYSDVQQGVVGDCYFVASLGEVALKSPSSITNMFIVNGDGTYTVRFYNNGKADYVTVDSQLPVDRYGRMVFANMGNYANSSSNVLWVAMAEKAYAQVNEQAWLRIGLPGNGVNSYQAIAGGYFSQAVNQIANRSSTTAYVGSSTFETFKTAFDANKFVGFASASTPQSNLVVGGHQYVAISYNATAKTVTLFNPWGVNNGSSYPGLVTMSWTQLAGSFSYWDRA